MGYQSDYANAIARIEEARAASQADATRANADIWGRTVSNLGQMISQIPEQRAQLAIVKQRAEAAERQRKKDEEEGRKQEQMKMLLQKHGGFNDAFIDEYAATVDPIEGSKLREGATKAKIAALDWQDKQLTHQTNELNHWAGVFGNVSDDDTYAQAKYTASLLGNDITKFPDSYVEAKPFIESLKIGTEEGRKQTEAKRKEIAEERARLSAETAAKNTAADNARADAQLEISRAQLELSKANTASDNARADAQQKISQAQLGVSQGHLKLAQEQAARGNAAGEASGIPANYDLLLNRATLSIPAIRRPAIVATAKMAYEQQGEKGLKDVIREAAVETENVDTKNQVMGRMATIASLKDTIDILDNMAKAGVPTNILVGTAEDVARKLGTSTNPKYVELANRLMGTLINYRRAATGVQFSEKESADYQKMFPNYKNTLPVNKALISGLLREMATYDRAYWTHKLGAEGAELLGVVPSTKSTTTEGFDVVAPNGKTYHFKTKAQAEGFKARAGIK